MNSLMDDIATYFSAPTDYGEMPLIDGGTLKISSEYDRPVVFDFKTLNDAQQGRLSFLKVLTGTIEPGTELVNARTRKGERLAHLYVMCGREMTEVGHAYAGDIVVVPKMSAETGDTLSVTGKVEAAAFKFTNSQYRNANEAENRSDEDKLFTFIETACEADPTMSIDRDEETALTVISAGGEAQVSVLLYRLEDRTKVAAHLVPLGIPSFRCAFRIARPSVAWRAPRAVIRSRPAAPASSAIATCVSSRCSTAPSTSSSTRSWVAASRARSSPRSTRACRRP